MNRLLKIMILALLLISVACSKDSDSDDDEGGGVNPPPPSGNVTARFDTSATTDSAGEATVTITIPDGTDKFSITALNNRYLAFDIVRHSSGTTYIDFEGEQITLSTSIDALTSAVNIPSRDFDPAVKTGTYTVRASVSSSPFTFQPAANEEVVFQVLGISDANTSRGAVGVNVILIGDAGDDEFSSAISQAISNLQRIYSGEARLSPNISTFSFNGPSAIPNPIDGSTLYGSISNAVPSPAVNLCLGIDIDSGGSDLLGISPGIPGTPLPSQRSCVAISLSVHAGSDGSFSNAEAQLLGETMAHEAGHYFGLFHPVESDFTTFDPLTDTPQCSSFSSCASAQGSNLMFYTPVSGTTQDRLTSQQAGVMNLYSASN